MRLLIPLILSLLLVSCAGETISERVAAAEMAFAAEDVAATRQICASIVQDTVKGSFTASELARLSILYMQLNEHDDDPEAVELAANCYRLAFRCNADSARAFYESLPSEDMKYAMTLASLVEQADNPVPLDSLPDDSHGLVDSIGAVK